jgi:hypothetical protein
MKNLFLAILIFTSSCTDKFSKAYYIAGEQKKYWDIVDSTGHLQGCYLFSKDGSCFYYIYNKRNNCSRDLFDDGDNIFEKKWELKNNSILRYRSNDRKIIIINEDTILTQINSVNILLLKSKCQKDNPASCNEVF